MSNTGQIIRASQYTAIPNGQTELFGPSIFRIKDQQGAFTHKSAVRLQNTSDSATAYISVTFTPRPDNEPACMASNTITKTIPPGNSIGLNTGHSEFDWMDNNGTCSVWRGTVRVVSNGPPLAGIINTMWPQVKRSGSHAMFGPQDARAVVIFPKQIRSYGQWSRINVMNISDETVSVRTLFYDAYSSAVYWHGPMTLQPYEAVVLNTKDLSGFPYGFTGSAVAYSLDPVRPALVGTGDLMYSDAHPYGNRAAIYEGVGQ